ncbi:TetR/AcrR family transcriptional regulator [Aquabacterium sp.]|uniref:TetR/AcrR family transcriptional regulator n=1 Tax=Aquabacterium sp. TaxID=1872578 RepID=UPI003783684E
MSRPPQRPVSQDAADPTPRDTYHHGALRDALIAATESLIAERGAHGFSLREVARRSGVSPSAPAHHFGDAAGLLAAVARLAFDQLTEALQAGNARGGDDPLERLCEQGVGYVGFALAWPGRFALMFRADLLRSDEALAASADAAYGVLEDGIRDLFALPRGAPLDTAQEHALRATWSMVHGFAHLMLAGQFDGHLPRGGRKALVRETVAPMLRQHLVALRPAKLAQAQGARGRQA